MSTNAEHLARRVLARRHELDMSQLDVWQAGGPSNTTLTKIENGEMEALARTTARKLDTGLRWEPGSARRVFEGGEPTPLREERPAGELERLRRDIETSRAIDEATRARLLADLDAMTQPPAPPPPEPERRWGT